MKTESFFFTAARITAPLEVNVEPILQDMEEDSLLHRIQEEQARDYHRAECELNLILMKLKSGEYKREDVFRLEGLLKFMGVNVG